MMHFLIIIISFCSAQWYSLDYQGVNRTYLVSYPENSDNIESIPLIINMHGYGGNAQQQQIYSQMDQFAHAQNIAVVYPEGLNNSWNVFTYWDSNAYDDVGFISMMIDDIAENFNIDLDRVYACGMSNGGYMSYRLACDLSDKIAAIGSVTGNFMINNDENDCLDQNREIPIIHFHGTADAVVNYYPPSFDGALTVEESINFWTNYNNLNQETILEFNSNVEIFKYDNESTSTEFIHYKIYGGGHEWFGSPWAINWGFNTSLELINFFSQYKLSDFYQIDGDLNDDGLVNVQDIILIINLILNSDYNYLGDLNFDNQLDVLDIVIFISIILE